MLRIDASHLPIFCDWLDVTTPPDREDELRSVLGPMFCSAGASKVADDLYSLGDGKIKIGLQRRIFRVSISGSSIRALIIQNVWGNVLSALGDGAHRVTRLDAAVDLDLDGADALEQLQRAYPSGLVRLSSRAIKVTEMLCIRPDGRRTGTWYAGHRSAAETTCRVYDKAQQLLDTRGVQIHQRTRAELTVRKGCTLRDAFEPYRVFWHYMSPAILRRPQGLPEWSPGWAEGWTMERIEILPAQRLRNLIERSADLSSIIELADSMGPEGRAYALRLVRKRLEGTPGVSSLSSPKGATRSVGS